MFQRWAPSSSGLESVWYLFRSWCVDSSLTYQFLLTFFFLSPELPRRYISVGFTGVSDLMDIFLTFYIDYSMYSASALSANTAIRSAVAAAFPLFTVQLFTNVSRCSFFLVLYSNTDYFGPLIVGYKLGVHFDRLHRAPVLAISLLILQIWCQNTSP